MGWGGLRSDYRRSRRRADRLARCRDALWQRHHRDQPERGVRGAWPSRGQASPEWGRAMNGLTLDLSTLDFSKGGGLVTVIAQDANTGAVLMLAHADREALERTIATGEMHYRSRSRGAWRKGNTSGNVQRVLSLTSDCDRDAVLARDLKSTRLN